MNRNSVFSIGLAALAMLMSACATQTSSPTGPGDGSLGGSTGGDPGILAKLSEPAAYVDVIDPTKYRFVFSAYASGTSDSEPMIATRTIQTVEFEVHAASGAIIDKQTSREVVLTGVRTPEDIASITVIADVMWPISASVNRGSYVIAVVRGRNGEVLVRRANLPLNDQ